MKPSPRVSRPETLLSSLLNILWDQSDERPDARESRQGRTSAPRARGGLFDATRGISPGRAKAVPGRYAVALVRAATQGRAGALLHQRADRALLVGDQIQRHHACRYQPRHVLFRLDARRHLDP